jgi:SAM-dependent methyltransferase
MCSFMIFHMSERTRRKGIAEIHRVLKPHGRLLVLDLALPVQPLPKAIARMLFGGMLNHDLLELLPLMDASGFSEIEIAPAKFRILGLSIVAFVRGTARKG